jgi:aspartate aminotransferase-like enzyme
MFENERLFLKLINAPRDSKAIFLTSSGTGGMEATLTNTVNSKDKVLVVNGGSFGERWVELCSLHKLSFSEIKLPFGKNLTEEHLKGFDGQGYTVMLIQAHETSTGEKFDLDLVARFCQKNKIFLIVDAISSFLADHIDMKKMRIDVLLTGSQKGLAVPPGITLLALDKQAIERAKIIDFPYFYFNFNVYLDNMKRGQTPFTPAIPVLVMVNLRLKEIDKNGIEASEKRCAFLASYFRNRIKDLPLSIFSETPSNAETCLEVSKDKSAYHIFEIIKDKYHIFVCPSGGDLSEKTFRVGHIGNLNEKDYDKLIKILHILNKGGIL